MSDLEPGTVLQNTYRVLRPIGRGGMGQVYEVAHARLAGRYALKLLTHEAAADAEFLQRFKREAEIVSALRHPNIVQVIDFDRGSDGRPYLVMELLDGEDLAARIGRAGPLPLSRVTTIISQIAAALEAAHARGVIHRDLKPENVLLLAATDGSGDFVKLVDFGISKVKNASLRLTQERMMLGTPHYMSPEQARSQDVDERADQFALAAIAYELLSGELAFAGDNVAAVVYQVVHGEPPRLADPGGWITPAVDGVLRQGLAKRSQDRFASVADFARALTEAARDVGDDVALSKPRPASATTRRTREQVITQRRARPGRTLAAVVAIGLAIIGGAWTILRAPHAPAIVATPAVPVTTPDPAPVAAAPVAAAPAPAAAPATTARAPAEAHAPPPAPPSQKPARRSPTPRHAAKPQDPLYNDL
jgi:serine/threonine-protein kinase